MPYRQFSLDTLLHAPQTQMTRDTLKLHRCGDSDGCGVVRKGSVVVVMVSAFQVGYSGMTTKGLLSMPVLVGCGSGMLSSRGFLCLTTCQCVRVPFSTSPDCLVTCARQTTAHCSSEFHPPLGGKRTLCVHATRQVTMISVFHFQSRCFCGLSCVFILSVCGVCVCVCVVCSVICHHELVFYVLKVCGSMLGAHLLV